MIKQEGKFLLNNKLLLLVFLAVIAIPTIYTTLFLGSMWDPYGKVDSLPVAVVNQDKAAGYNGKTLNIGEQMTDNLKKDKSLDFSFVSSKKAMQGLKDGSYYMVITIPGNFSANAATVLDQSPKKMELKYETNPGTNYIASKLSETALSKIRTRVANSVTEVYTKAVFEQIGTIGKGMELAADGSLKLEDGSVLLADGNKQITDNLTVLADSTLTFQDGSDTLSVGLRQYTDGVSDLEKGTSDLKDGLHTLDSGTGALTAGITDLTNGAVQLDSGVSGYTQSVSALNAGALDLISNNQYLAEGMETLSQGVNALTQNGETLTQGVEEASAYINQALALLNSTDISAADNSEENAQTIQNIQTAAAILQAVQVGLDGDGSSPGLSAGMSTYTAGVSQLQQALGTVDRPGTLTQGMNSYLAGAQTLSDGLQSLDSNSTGLSQGASALNSGLASLSQQAPVLATGISELYDGSIKLTQGANQLTAENETLVFGSSQLTEGATKISGGAGQLGDASASLGNGINQIKDGASSLTENLSSAADSVNSTNAGDSSITMFSDPVSETEETMTSVENNGHAMAPYMMSVALWVAGIAFSIIYPLTRYEGELTLGIAWWASKGVILTIISILDALVMVLSLYFFNGFRPKQLGNTLLLACLASLTFMSIMYFFNAAFGKVGSFLMLIYMVIQLSGAAGTYPVELSGSFVSNIHDFLPFTYTVDAFRSTISGGPGIRPCVLVLITLLVICSALTILLFSWRAKKIKEQKPLLLDFLEEKGLA